MNEQTILTDLIIKQIIPYNKNYLKENIIISIKDDYIIINTKKNEYTLKIEKENSIFLEQLYKSNNLIYSIEAKNNFKDIINFILKTEE